MKRTIITFIFSAVFLASVFTQAKKPKIMVVPSDNWCVKNGYTLTFDNQGTETVIPDYKKAVQNSTELLLVISKINTLMAERGFPTVDLEASLKKLENDAAYNSMNTNQYGTGIAESPIDILNRTAKADIVMKLTWALNETGPKKSITFILQGIDAYTSKQIAGATGTGTPSFSAEIPVLLEEAVLAHLGNFNDQLMTHFEDLVAKGREGSLVVQVWADAADNLDTEYELNGRTAELKTILNRFWMPRNTKEGRFALDNATENQMTFSQVRIPLEGDDGWGGTIAMDFFMFGENLAQFLKDEFGIVCKVQPRGLGEVYVILGAK